ncbi:unnamed protein product [Lampetra fluviatilis]
MSKHLNKKNTPAPSSDDDDDSLTQDLPTPGAVDPVTVTTAGATIAPGKDVGAAPSSSPGADDGWRRVAEQIDSLRTVLLHLMTLVASSAAPGWPQDMLPSGDVQGSLRGASEGPLVQNTAAIMPAEGPSAITTAVDATWPDVLDPLILGKILELSKEMGIPQPVCGHEPLTSRWAARCLDAQDNLRRWTQMATWTGDPGRDVEPKGWAPSKVVHIPDDVGVGDLATAAPRWDPRRRPDPRREGSYKPRGADDGATWWAGMTCFKCGRMGLPIVESSVIFAVPSS